MKSIRILLAHAIDYAGLFPPAALSMDAAVRNYESYRACRDAWALGRFVAPLPRARETGLPADWLSLVEGTRECPGPVEYLERPRGLLAEVRKNGTRAKVRTGGIKPELFPSCEELAAFICECAGLNLPFKATAGLHHAIRGSYPLTYEPDSAVAVMHGFLNVLLAAGLAWHGGTGAAVRATLEMTDASAFHFSNEGVEWLGHRLPNAQLASAREEFIVSFGSCSFEEPIRELGAMGLL